MARSGRLTGGEQIKGHVLALDGAADPVVNAQAVAAFQKEMTEGAGRWSFAAA
jgi:dienelactone hydrolase